MDETQITKSKSISFNEYLYGIITNTKSSFATGWGFFVFIDEEPNQIKKQTVKPNYTIKPITQVIVRKNSIKSFPSISNLQSPNLQSPNLQSPNLQNIDEISETIFEMDLLDIDKKYNYKFPNSLYNNIKTNIYFIGTVILYGSAACIKIMIDY
jgi:hypothetical protein